MSSDNNNNNNKSIIKLVGYSAHGYSDLSRDTYSAVDIYTLELEVLPKNTRLRNYLLFDYQDGRKSKEESLIPAIGSKGQVIGLRKSQHFLDSEVLYVPIRLIGRRWYSVPESEIDIYRDESKEDDNTFWQDEIPGNVPFRELMEKANPRLEEASHPVIIDEELTAKSEVNSNERSEDLSYFSNQYHNVTVMIARFLIIKFWHL